MRASTWLSSAFLLLFLTTGVFASGTVDRRKSCETKLKEAFFKTGRKESDLKRPFEAYFVCKETGRAKELRKELSTTRSFTRLFEIQELLSQITHKQPSSFETEIQNVCGHLDLSLTRIAETLDQMDCQPTFQELREKIGTSNKLESEIRICEITDWPLPINLVLHRLISSEFDKVVNGFKSKPKDCRKPYVSERQSKAESPPRTQTGDESDSSISGGSYSGE